MPHKARNLHLFDLIHSLSVKDVLQLCPFGECCRCGILCKYIHSNTAMQTESLTIFFSSGR